MGIHVDGQKMRDLADGLKKQLPGYAFALLVFQVDELGGVTNYISNAKREDMITAMEAQLISLKKGKDFKTPNSN